MRILIIVFLVTVCLACSSPVATPETNPDVLILGSWVVSSAVVNGSAYPITNPGFGQMEALFETDMFTYIFPEVGSNGMLTGNTDTLYANWSFNDAYDTLSFNYLNTSERFLSWHVKALQVGRLSTDYISRSAEDQSQESRYDIDYRLK